MNQLPVYDQAGGWTLSPWSGSMLWPRSEVNDPCFDGCKYTGSAGLIAAFTQLATTGALPDPGYYLIRVTVCFGSGGAAGAVPIQVAVRRDANAASEIVGLLQAAENATEAKFDLLCNLKRGGDAFIQNVTAIAIGQTVHSTLHWKRISR